MKKPLMPGASDSMASKRLAEDLIEVLETYRHDGISAADAQSGIVGAIALFCLQFYGEALPRYLRDLADQLDRKLALNA
jgi:hypothetical protein